MKQITMWEKLEELERKEEVEEITRNNQGLVWKTIHMMEKKGHLINYRKTFDMDDIFQIGSIGLFKAARKYDPSKGYQFSTYAIRSIRNTILTELEKNTYKKTGESYDSLNTTYEDYECHDSREMDLDTMNLDYMFERILIKHPDERAALLHSFNVLRKYGEGYTWTDIAKENNVSVFELKKGLEHLRKRFKEVI